jgi:hypothetical protein
MFISDIDKFIVNMFKENISILSYKKTGKLFIWYYLCYHFKGSIIKKIYSIIVFLLGKPQSIINIVKNIANFELHENIDLKTTDECFRYISQDLLLLKKEPCYVYQ